MFNVSRFGKKIKNKSGISHLMDDLGTALAGNQDVLMLGGGNPAHIPEVQQIFRDKMLSLLSQDRVFEKVIGDYDPPNGNTDFRRSLAQLLNTQYHWNISESNIALTAGSQTAFFILFNIFAGECNGIHKKILFPLAPEYIGYTDVGLTNDLFVCEKPEITLLGDHLYKYHIDFDQLKISNDIGAICVSRPTNPTANVLTNEEITRLSDLAAAHHIPLIIDNAYGTPFPNIIYTEATPIWNENIILCMSLSKLGLPGTRTGIVIASEEVTAMISEMNAIMSLSPGSFGAALATEIVRTGEIMKICQEYVVPYYKQKARKTLKLLLEELDGLNYHIHKPEGAIFLWLWFHHLPISNAQLYQRLKEKGVLVIPGHYFFPGLNDDWDHKHECIRITYAQNDDIVEEGIKRLASVARAVYLGK